MGNPCRVERFVDRQDLVRQRGLSTTLLFSGGGHPCLESSRGKRSGPLVRLVGGSASVSNSKSTSALPRSSGVAAIHAEIDGAESLGEMLEPSRSSSRRMSISILRRAGSSLRPFPSSAISSRAALSMGRLATGAPTRRAERRSSSGGRGLVAFSCAFSITSPVSSRKDASVRLRGPLGVLCDSRISNLPLFVGTTKVIVV